VIFFEPEFARAGLSMAPSWIVEVPHVAESPDREFLMARPAG
jgi:hypothetical protein